MTISGLSIVCGYSTHCTKYILFTIKISIMVIKFWTSQCDKGLRL